MRILLIDVNCKSGSTGKIVYDLYSEINKNKNEAAIAYGRGKKIKEKNIYKFGLDLETFFHFFMSRLTGIHGAFSFFSTKRLIKFINKFKPDIIHIHELHGYFVNIVSLLKFIKKTSIKIIWTFHCEYMYEGKGFILNKEKNKFWNRKNEYPRSLFFDLSLWTVNRYKKILNDITHLSIVTPSNWLMNNVKKTYLSKFGKKVIKNGVNQEIFNPNYDDNLFDKYNIPRNKKIILSVAPDFTDVRKGGKIIIEIALKTLNSNYVYILVGNHGFSNLPKNIISIPRTSNQLELAKLYSLADVFLITSLIENFPTTCIEALSCGTPVIGLRGGGTEETAPKPFGYFFTNNKIDDLVDFIIYNFDLLINQEMLVSLLSYSKDYLSKQKMMLEYFNLYEEEFSL